MIDFRILTYITLCNTESYTKTAEVLSLTQPAITQHIKYLETHYNTKLIHYENKKFSLTESGKVFFKYAINAYGNSIQIEDAISHIKNNKKTFNFGATLSIGEFTMSSIIGKYLFKYPDAKINMEISNTHTLVNKVLCGDLDFAFIEGCFNKDDFHTQLLKNDNFVVAVSPKNPLAQRKNINLSILKSERLILREKGSGSRDVAEKILANGGLSIDSFNHITEIGNVNVIKDLVKHNLGITFMFKEALKKDLDNHSLKALNVIDINIKREFNFIYLHNNIYSHNYDEFFQFCKENLQ